MAHTTGSDDLYRLIHSLTAEEKGYFKKFALRHTSSGNKYLDLFDIISKQKEFEEASLKKKFKDLPVLKVYLFNMILQSIIASGSAALPVDEVMSGLLRVNAMARKGITKRALKQARELKEFASQKGLHIWQGIVARTEHSLGIPFASPRQSIELAHKIYNEIKEVSAAQLQQDELMFYQRILFGYVKLQEFGDEPVDIDKELDITSLLKINPLNEVHSAIRLSALKAYYSIKGDVQKAYDCCEELYDIQRKRWLQWPTRKEATNYYATAEGLIHACFNTWRIARVHEIYNQIKMIEVADTHLRTSFYIKMDNTQLLIYWFTGQHSQGLQQWPLLNHLKDEKPAESYFPTLHYEAYSLKALFEFSTGKLAEAFKTLNYFSQPQVNVQSPTHQKGAELLKLLMQIETADTPYIMPLVKHIRKKFKNLDKHEDLFLQLVSEYYLQPETLYHQYQSHHISMQIFSWLNVSLWIKARLQKKGLAEIFRSEYELKGK